MARKRGLGKGLDALIPTGDEPPPSGGILQVSIDDIQPNPRQPRSDFDEEGLKALSDSIRAHGILQPLIVTPDAEGEGYVLVAGERRWQAARKAGLTSIPVLVRQVDEQQRLEWTLVENLQRTDLNPLEAAEGYRQLVDEFGLSHQEIAERVGKSRTAISNTLRLLKLSAAARNALTEGEIREGHARALLSLSSTKAQSAALRTVLQRSLSVRQTEELVRRLSGERKTAAPPAKKTPEEIALEDQLRQELGTKVTLKRSQRGGSIIIHYYSDEELNTLIERLLGTSSE
ncbi:MAG: ParB/RepB/Spo0J family partition protein [Anaerolineales bacterium]|nr:ParB/RepB/Spo0J family partition protein [Anaerolineales bacterium]